jgi:RimJ/RimL family protein N-acetyltransferase
MSDTWEQLARYRQIKVLPDGLRVLLRPLADGDTEKLYELFAHASSEDLERFRSEPPDLATVECWVEDRDYRRVLPVVVEANDRIVGQVALHFGDKFQHHLAWVRLFLDREFRRRSIGTLMIRSTIDLARRVGLHQLIALVPTDQPQVVKAFEQQGFKSDHVHEDYAILADGRTLDVAELVLRMVDHSGEF